jgi:hypothetical protein
MKRSIVYKYFLLSSLLVFYAVSNFAQCSICTKTASQLGEKPAAALNTAILYLMMAPLAIIGFIGWKWWKANKS